jgi:hypothetical protein
MYIIVRKDNETSEDLVPIFSEHIQYSDKYLVCDRYKDKYNNYDWIWREDIVVVKEVSVTQLNEAIKSL